MRLCTLITTAAILSTLPGFAADKTKQADKEKEVPAYYAAQPSTETLDLTMYQRIEEEGFQHSHVMEFASALNDGIGPRLTGSPNMAKANAWTRDTLTKIGLENARLESWGDFGMGWQQLNTWVRMSAPDTAVMVAQAAPWSPSTNGPISGQAVWINISDEKALDSYKGKLAGKIVLLGDMRPVGDLDKPLFHRYTDEELKEFENYTVGGRDQAAFMVYVQQRLKALDAKKKAVQFLAAEHVAAILTPARDSGDNGGTGILFDDNGAALVRDAQVKDNAVTIPNAVMMIESYGRIYRMLKANIPVTLEVDIDTRFTGDHEQGFNTIAEIPGTDPALKNQVVMVGGHLDSWISGTGATDNGAGSVVAMEAVRILKSLGVSPRRTIRIALWSGEEQGLYGSRGYVKNHFGDYPESTDPAQKALPSFLRTPGGPLQKKPEWETLDAYYNLDNGTGKVRGVYLQENAAIGPIFAQWIAPLKGLGVTTISPRNTGGTDHLSFDAVGLAGFQYIQDPMDYETRTHHSNMDTVERLHAADLEQAAVVEAIFLYNTAQRDQMMPRKPLPHPETDKQRSAPIPDLFPGAVSPGADGIK